MSDFVIPPEYRIIYPSGVVMRSCGGNGNVNTKGLDIELVDDRVIFRPVNSQRTVASNCHIEMPADLAVVRAVISRLREIALALNNNT